PGLNNTATIAWSTDEPATSRVDYGSSPTSLTSNASSPTLTTTHAIVLSGLTPLATYYYQVTSADAAGNTSASPVASFTMPATTLVATDTTVADFSGGKLDGNEYVAATADGEVILAPAGGSEFFGSSLPADWSTTAWNAGGTATVGGGSLFVDGSR